jgi:hypothetical protein
LVAVPQIFDRGKSVALWSTKKEKRTIKGYGSAATYKYVKTDLQHEKFNKSEHCRV